MPTFLLRERIGDFAVHPTSPQSLSVQIAPGVILSNTGAAISGIPDSINYGSAQVSGLTLTAGPLAPAAVGNVRKDLIAIATDLSVHVFTGVEVVAPGPAVCPTFPANLIPLAEISITDIITQIDTSDIQDLRPFLTPHQDRSRTIPITTLLPGTTPPYSGTSAGFETTNFIPSVDRDVKFSFTIPEDFDYNREMKLYLRGFTGGAGGGGNIEWEVVSYWVARGAAAGAYPPAVNATTNTITAANDDLSDELHTIALAVSAGSTHFAIRALKPKDVVALNVKRKGTSGSDTYLGIVSIVEATIAYNLGYSVYPG